MRRKLTTSLNMAEESAMALAFPACATWKTDIESTTPTDPRNTSHMLWGSNRPQLLGSTNCESCTCLDKHTQGGVYIANFTHMCKIPLNYGARNGGGGPKNKPWTSSSNSPQSRQMNRAGAADNTKPPHRIPRLAGKHTKHLETHTTTQISWKYTCPERTGSQTPWTNLHNDSQIPYTAQNYTWSNKTWNITPRM